MNLIKSYFYKKEIKKMMSEFKASADTAYIALNQIEEFINEATMPECNEYQRSINRLHTQITTCKRRVDQLLDAINNNEYQRVCVLEDVLLDNMESLSEEVDKLQDISKAVALEG